MIGLAGMLLGGCAGFGGPIEHDSAGRPPSRAEVVYDRVGHVSWLANHNGVIYLYDVDEDAILYEGHMSDGDRIISDEKEATVSVNGRVVSQLKRVRGAHRFRLYFVRQ